MLFLTYLTIFTNLVIVCVIRRYKWKRYNTPPSASFTCTVAEIPPMWLSTAILSKLKLTVSSTALYRALSLKIKHRYQHGLRLSSCSGTIYGHNRDSQTQRLLPQGGQKHPSPILNYNVPDSKETLRQLFFQIMTIEEFNFILLDTQCIVSCSAIFFSCTTLYMLPLCTFSLKSADILYKKATQAN